MSCCEAKLFWRSPDPQFLCGPMRHVHVWCNVQCAMMLRCAMCNDAAGTICPRERNLRVMIGYMMFIVRGNLLRQLLCWDMWGGQINVTAVSARREFIHI